MKKLFLILILIFMSGCIQQEIGEKVSIQSEVIKTIEGKVTIQRGVQTIFAQPGMDLKIGDIVYVEKGKAEIIVKSGQITLTDGMTHQVTGKDYDPAKKILNN